jgi:hypothetical protein
MEYVNPHGKKCECDFCFDNGFGAVQYIYDD